MMRVKDWERFQHYKYKNAMPWFKLHGRDLLNNAGWNKLEPLTKVTLIEVWCLGAENNGKLPDIETISFRLRQSIKVIQNQITILIEQGYIVECLEGIEQVYTIASTDKIRLDKDNIILKKDNIIVDQFDIFWGAYPRKIGKANAEKAWIKHKPPIDIVLKTLLWQIKSKEWFQDNGKYIPHPTTWLNAKRWLDEKPEEVTF